jgi:hypothetical protein
MSLINRPSRSARRNSPRLRLAGAVLGIALVTASLASCSAAPDLDRNAARQLQSKVLAVTGAAAANDPAASLKHLDAFVLELDEAAARGEVSFRRHQSISKSVDAVRADLKARQAEAARVAAEQKAKAAADKAAADKAAADKGSGGSSRAGRRSRCSSPARRRARAGRQGQVQGQG